MSHRPAYQRNDSYSDTSSFYSVRSGSARSADSVSSVWSSTESDAYVYRIDPWGFDGVGGAVTRYVDERDDSRKRFAAHILRGPFAQFYKKHQKHASSSGARSGRSAGNSRSSSRSSGGSVSPGRGHGGHHQHYHSRPPSVEPQFHQEPFPGEPYPPEQFHQGPFQHHFQGPPPPPPPPPAPGFEGGFIQLGGNNGPPPPPDPAWGNNAGYGHGVQVFD
ncbi:hypothetical protein F5Y04DRAFT_192931 [Hypomontagnella monticulosa]|nr:hypothetical protein F5Y04DRAFT_192931 [Hypomontagnella monticulosa]